jgi:hypothetical protein
LIVDDLGPVLSLTGSLGASCIAYVAPGLAYLGVNGGDFLEWVSGHAAPKTDPEVELPVVGDAAASMVTVSEQQQSRWDNDGSRRKPWWWWLVGMPLWVTIASAGERGTREFLTEFGGTAEEDEDDHEATALDENRYTVGPNRRDYYISIVFIVFGVVAAVCGVLSNIYVQVHKIFFVPR